MAATERKRFPIGLTIATAIAFAILCGLGTWQLQRLHWKRDLLVRIEAARAAPARPLAEVLEGGDADFARVVVDCVVSDQPRSKVMLYGISEGRPAWRPMAPCRIAAPYNGLIVVDRGVVASESPMPPDMDLANPMRVVGVLRRPEIQGAAERIANAGVSETGPGFHDRIAAMKAVARLASGRASEYVLVAESETPAPAGVMPAPLPTNISNRHLEYVVTWFGLAAALAGVYAAMVWRRMKT